MDSRNIIYLIKKKKRDLMGNIGNFDEKSFVLYFGFFFVYYETLNVNFIDIYFREINSNINLKFVFGKRNTHKICCLFRPYFHQIYQ